MSEAKINEDVGPNKAMWLALACLVIVLDQIAKYYSEKYLGSAPLTVFPGFDLWLAHNSGAAFSFLSNAGGWQRWFFTVSSTLISGVILVWLLRLPKSQKLLSFSLAMIFGGAIGNLIDRALVGYVIDFISIYSSEYRFATFNLADSAICLGAGLMMLDMFLHRDNKES